VQPAMGGQPERGSGGTFSLLQEEEDDSNRSFCEINDRTISVIWKLHCAPRNWAAIALSAGAQNLDRGPIYGWALTTPQRDPKSSP
jgi:hypothetical protein